MTSSTWGQLIKLSAGTLGLQGPTERRGWRQAEYGCSATCGSAVKAKTTALAKERQTRLKHVEKKMSAAKWKALDTLQEEEGEEEEGFISRSQLQYSHGSS